MTNRAKLVFDVINAMESLGQTPYISLDMSQVDNPVLGTYGNGKHFDLNNYVKDNRLILNVSSLAVGQEGISCTDQEEGLMFNNRFGQMVVNIFVPVEKIQYLYNPTTSEVAMVMDKYSSTGKYMIHPTIARTVVPDIEEKAGVPGDAFPSTLLRTLVEFVASNHGHPLFVRFSKESLGAPDIWESVFPEYFSEAKSDEGDKHLLLKVPSLPLLKCSVFQDGTFTRMEDSDGTPWAIKEIVCPMNAQGFPILVTIGDELRIYDAGLNQLLHKGAAESSGLTSNGLFEPVKKNPNQGSRVPMMPSEVHAIAADSGGKVVVGNFGRNR